MSSPHRPPDDDNMNNNGTQSPNNNGSQSPNNNVPAELGDQNTSNEPTPQPGSTLEAPAQRTAASSLDQDLVGRFVEPYLARMARVHGREYADNMRARAMEMARTNHVNIVEIARAQL